MLQFNQIKKRVTQESKERTAKHIAEFKSCANILEHWNYSGMLTKRQKETKTDKEQRQIIIDKIKKNAEKELQKNMAIISAVESAPALVSALVAVEWKKNRTWGANPRATAQIHTENGWTTSESSSISGCGYDKLSCAVSEALDGCESVLQVLYITFEKALKKDKNACMRDVLGYGSGYGFMPSLEGGAGVSCYPGIFEKCGYKFEYGTSGKTFDTFTISKGAKK